jgi:lipopolysaccharide transport protein LptA
MNSVPCQVATNCARWRHACALLLLGPLFMTSLMALAPATAQSASLARIADPTKPITLDAASSDFNYRDNVLVFRKVRISQGALSVEAAEATATGLNFQSSQWSFRGDVHIHLPDGSLESQAATVTFRGNEIVHALITGNPATFEQHRSNPDQLARGRAGTIEYDIARGSVRLSDQAWLSDGRNEITGQTLVYNIRDQRILANPNEQDHQGVSIIINPQTSNSQPKGPPSPSPASQSPMPETPRQPEPPEPTNNPTNTAPATQLNPQAPASPAATTAPAVVPEPKPQ